MKLQTIEMPVEEAKQAYLDYRRAVRAAKTAATNSEDAQIARCYKALSEERQIINIMDAFARAGEDKDGLPRLAITRADSQRILLARNWGAGSCDMYPAELGGYYQNRPYEGQVFQFTSLSERESPFRRPSWDRKTTVAVNRFTALVPNIPPRLRPPHDLKNYHLLWEAKWDIERPRSPRDPALLKHLGGPLYAVLATWDLTPVEQAVLGVTRS